MQPSFTLVSNRLPVSVKKVEGKLEFYPSVGGLATGLGSYAKNKRTLWIGWPGLPNEQLTAQDKAEITKGLRTFNCYPVFLSEKQVEGYYNGYCNSILWPLFHDIAISKTALRSEFRYWQSYKEVNALFAKAIVALSKHHRPTIWVQDYQLLLLPSLLRSANPRFRLGFFLHIPFPQAASFMSLPRAEELLRGVLGSDLVGFHTEPYVHHFLDAASSLGIGTVTNSGVALEERVVRIQAFPMGIDYGKYAQAASTRRAKRELNQLRLRYRGRKLILTVDRLDPTKGLLERVAAFGQFLRQNVHLHGKVVMAMVVVPSRIEITQYKQLKANLEQLIKNVNKEFGSSHWQPIDYIYRGLPFDRLSAFYQRADVAFIVPFRDGMNLVAKEYLASQTRHHGVLVLSQTAGAAQELKDAIIVDPTRLASLVGGLNRAIRVPKLQWRERITKMQQQLRTATVHTWASDFLQTLHSPFVVLPTRTHSLNRKYQAVVVKAFQAAQKRLLLLDYDGTLVNIADRPEEARPSKKLQEVLRQLASLPDTEVVIISGRPRSDLLGWFDDLPVGLAAEHGAFYRPAGSGHWHRLAKATYTWKQRLLPLLEEYASITPGSFVEEKETALVWHYRLANPYFIQSRLKSLSEQLEPLIEKYALHAYRGKKIMEIRPLGIDKGKVAKQWLNDVPDFVLVAGDDYTDEDTFMAMPPLTFTLKVGLGKTLAKFRALRPARVVQLLSAISKSL